MICIQSSDICGVFVIDLENVKSEELRKERRGEGEEEIEE